MTYILIPILFASLAWNVFYIVPASVHAETVPRVVAVADAKAPYLSALAPRTTKSKMQASYVRASATHNPPSQQTAQEPVTVPKPPVKPVMPGSDTTAPIIPTQEPAPTSTSFSTIEQDVMAGINAARERAGLSPLSPDDALGGIARTHSADMLARNYFEHTDLSGCTLACRFAAVGYAYWSIGENIYWVEGYTLSVADAAQKVADSWMASPPHKENILGNFTRVGVGVAQSGSKVEATADFATPQ